MSEQARVAAATVVGAVVGATMGYLYLTAAGHRFRQQLEPKLDEALHEIGRLRQTVSKVQAVATEGWRSLSQIAGGSQAGRQGEFAGNRQASPF